MAFANMSKLNAEHFDLLERLYSLDKNALMGLPAEELVALFLPENDDSPLWDAMQDFDENYEPFPDTLLAEQICDILWPADIYHPE